MACTNTHLACSVCFAGLLNDVVHGDAALLVAEVRHLHCLVHKLPFAADDEVMDIEFVAAMAGDLCLHVARFRGGICRAVHTLREVLLVAHSCSRPAD